MVYLPGSTININITGWSAEKNRQIEDYIKPDFLACGCRAGRFALLASIFVSAICCVMLVDILNHYTLLFIYSILIFMIISAFTGKLVAVVYNRWILSRKIKEILLDNPDPVLKDKPDGGGNCHKTIDNSILIPE